MKPRLDFGPYPLPSDSLRRLHGVESAILSELALTPGDNEWVPELRQQLQWVRRCIKKKSAEHAKQMKKRIARSYRRTTYADLKQHIEHWLDEDDDEWHWLWSGRFNDAGEAVYRHQGHSRDEKVARTLFRLRRALPPGHRLVRLCGYDECVSPRHHASLDGLDGRELVLAVLGPRIRRERADGREHWLWKSGSKGRPQVSINGKTYWAASWAFEHMYPERYRPKLRLFQRDCAYLFCVNPACWAYRTTSYAHLYTRKKLKPGFSVCWVGKRRPDAKGYVRYGNRRLHRVVYEAHTGERLPRRFELHHLCGPGTRACCRPEHMQPMPKREHLALHARLRAEAPVQRAH